MLISEEDLERPSKLGDVPEETLVDAIKGWKEFLLSSPLKPNEPPDKSRDE